ncbi:A-kinase anchor protein 1-like protein, partial [Leptotrombidium deliense]
SVSVLIENIDAIDPEMQLREVNASNVYSGDASESANGKEIEKVCVRNKLNSRNVKLCNANHEKSNLNETGSSLIVDENNTAKYSNLSDNCVLENTARTKSDVENHNDLDSEIVIKCAHIDLNAKNELNEEQRNSSDSIQVIPMNSSLGATNNCDVNSNNEEFNNKNVNKTLNELDNVSVKDTQSDKPASVINIRVVYNNIAQGSSDSGKGSSDIQGCLSEPTSSTAEDSVIIYQFEIHQDLCGRLIGKNGHYVTLIKNESNARVIINRHPYSPCLKICSIEGLRSEIRQALYLIRKRFPVHDYPEVTLVQINAISPLPYPVPVPQSCQLHLPEGVSCDVIMWSMVNAGHIFLQQPTHPTYPSLSRLDQFMTATYSSMATPLLPNPIRMCLQFFVYIIKFVILAGVICAATIAGGWFRATIVDVVNDETCEVKFVDYGGYAKLPLSSLRQIRFDFMTLPFQASECYLGNVAPIGENGWTVDANTVFEELAQGQFLQANIVGYSDDGIPFVHLHRIQGASSIFINKELVDRGFARWVD